MRYYQTDKEMNTDDLLNELQQLREEIEDLTAEKYQLENQIGDYHVILDHLNHGLMILQNGTIVFANRVMNELTGFTTEELIGSDFKREISMFNQADKNRLLICLDHYEAGIPITEHYVVTVGNKIRQHKNKFH